MLRGKAGMVAGNATSPWFFMGRSHHVQGRNVTFRRPAVSLDDTEVCSSDP